MTEPPTPTSAAPLLELLEEHRRLVDQLEDLSSRQAALIENQNTDDLLEVLSQRQRIMDRLVESQERLARLSEVVAAGPGKLPDDQRQRIRDLIEVISRGLAEVLHRDRADRDALQACRDETHQEIKGLETARSAHRAYVRYRSAASRFADRQG